MMKRKFFSILLLAFVFQAVFAQEAAAPDNEDDVSLDFVITAGRTPEEANKVAGQVTVITAEDIAASGATTVTDLLQTVPGVRVARDNSGASLDVSMRGIGSDSGRGKVLVIIDGMRLNPVQGMTTVDWGAINLSDIERIEVLDGGGSVQYGDNAQVGVINIITKKSGAAKTDIAVSGGSRFQNEQRFSHHQPTGWGGFSVGGGHRGSQGYQKGTTNDTGNGELRGIFDINDTMSLQANVGFSATNVLYASPLTKAQFDDDPTQDTGTASGSISNNGVSAGLGFNWVINETFSFDLPVSYNWQSVKLRNSYMRLNITPQMLGVRPKITAELRPADMPLRFTGGVDMLAGFNKMGTSYDIVKETNPNTTELSEFTIGPWLLANFEPFSILSLNAGLRYDAAFIKGHQDAWTGSVMGLMPASYLDSDESTNVDAFVYEAGLVVNPFTFMKIYAKYGTQFKYPFLDQFVTVPTPTNGNVAISINTGLKPEEGWTVEGGIGLNFKQFVKVDANVYYLRIDNEISADALTLVYMNMDPIDRLGANIGLIVTPIKYVELDLDYGFVKAEFSDGPNEGKTVPLTAAHTLSGSLMLHLPFGLSLGPNMFYKSEMYPSLDNANTASIDSSLIWGLQARYVINKFKGDLAVQLTVHNLADTKYASLVYMGMIQTAPGEPAYYVDGNMDRSVNLSLQYSF